MYVQLETVFSGYKSGIEAQTLYICVYFYALR